MFFLKELPTRRMIEGYTNRHDSDPDAIEEALHLMRRASLLVRRVDAYFAAENFSQLRFLALIVIDREPERASLRSSEIAHRLDVSRPVITRTLQTLLKDGLIAEVASGQDQRAKLISLTDAGTARLQSLLPGYFKVIGNFMSVAHQSGKEPEQIDRTVL